MGFNLEKVNCNLCGESNDKPYMKIKYIDYIKRRPELVSDSDPIMKNKELADNVFNIVKCKKCGLVYVVPRLTEESLRALYQEEYFSDLYNDQSEAHKNRRETFKVEIKELEALIKKTRNGKKILDVGCGGGFFLDSLDDSWEKYGAEINSCAKKYGEETFGLNISCGKLKNIKFPDETFDVVKIRGTIEHLSDPKGELEEIYRILRKGGLIAVNTPNIGSLCGKLYKEKFRLADPIHHVYYFSTKTLVRMLREVGYTGEKVSYHYFDTPYASWRDIFAVLGDILSLRLFNKPETVSPSFYGNIVDVYAVK